MAKGKRGSEIIFSYLSVLRHSADPSITSLRDNMLGSLPEELQIKADKIVERKHKVLNGLTAEEIFDYFENIENTKYSNIRAKRKRNKLKKA